MLQVLIIDDEPSVVKSLYRSIDWGALGLEVAGIAANGEEGLKFAEKKKIDIAICDIRMPGISGLEVCEQLQNMFHNIQLIIISGYAEFAYAERAIRVGVVGYCLKPLDYEQVKRCLLKAKMNLRQAEGRMDVDSFLEVLRDGEPDEIRNYLQESGLEADCYAVAVLVEQERPVIFDGIAQVTLHLGRNVWGYLVRENDFMTWLSQLKDAQEKWKGCGYSKSVLYLENLYHELQECQSKACQYFISADQKICSKLDESKAAIWLESVRKETKKENLWKLLNQIDECASKDFTIRSVLKLHNSIGLFLEKPNQEHDLYSYSVEQLRAEYKDFHEMIENLKEKLREPDEEEKTENFSNASFMKILLYVDSHYTEDISLSGIAKVLFMSPSYIGQLFKKETGITFVQYLTQKRLEDAKQMLTSTDMLVTDISASVGFNDYFYFCRIFKKNTQLTPMQYRQKMGEDMDDLSI